jgi:quercetin dioxygenase-like cupin family protein
MKTTAIRTTPAPVVPLERPPDSFRPDRSERIVKIGEGPAIELSRQVRFECLVGQFNGARNLTTGLVTMAVGSKLDYHRHTFAESVTLLSGSLAFEVEGRHYKLNELDNIVVPAGLAHAARCTRDARLHIAMATHAPSRTLVDKFFSGRSMPDDSTGLPGAEHVTRPRTAEWFEPGEGASFIDYFNSALMPGLDMSGGYGLFQPGGRLPAHVHDFDESICIVEGLATCVVEGRRYQLSECATALQPRGRVHYFINDSQAPMAMVWVYAGPMPERIVVAEHCCTVEGNPWK